jgi:hypothetical protein
MRRLIKGKLVFWMIWAGWLTACGHARQPGEIRNVFLIGWEGASRLQVKTMLADGQLPHLDALRREGGLCDTQTTSENTQTKPGWVEILTGYKADHFKIFTTRQYRPIEKGYTVFERLEGHFGPDKIVTGFLSGKEGPVGFRGPHEICQNCFPRDPETRELVIFWDKTRIKQTKTMDGRPQKWIEKEGEPYFHAKDSIDVFRIGLGPAASVGEACLDALNQYSQQRFFVFCHFGEPADQGYLYGESSAEYRQGMIESDQWLGRIVQRLKELQVYENTAIIVTSAHGMDVNKNRSDHAPHMMAVINKAGRLRDGDRKDITPTIYEFFGVDVSAFSPSLDGQSLLADP